MKMYKNGNSESFEFEALGSKFWIQQLFQNLLGDIYLISQLFQNTNNHQGIYI